MNASDALNRLIMAAVVSKEFAQLLLSDAAEAIDAGYKDETFDLPPAERELLLSIQADSVQDFALQVHAGLQE